MATKSSPWAQVSTSPCNHCLLRQCKCRVSLDEPCKAPADKTCWTWHTFCPRESCTWTSTGHTCPVFDAVCRYLHKRTPIATLPRVQVQSERPWTSRSDWGDVLEHIYRHTNIPLYRIRVYYVKLYIESLIIQGGHRALPIIHKLTVQTYHEAMANMTTEFMALWDGISTDRKLNPSPFSSL